MLHAYILHVCEQSCDQNICGNFQSPGHHLPLRTAAMRDHSWLVNGAVQRHTQATLGISLDLQAGTGLVGTSRLSYTGPRGILAQQPTYTPAEHTSEVTLSLSTAFGSD